MVLALGVAFVAIGAVFLVIGEEVIPTPSHLSGHISPIFSPFFLAFCAFSPSRRGGSNGPQAGTQGRETAGTGVQTPFLRAS